MGVELLELDLGFEAFLGFHDYIHQFVVVNLPFFDATEVAGAAFVVDDERHNVVAQAFLEHNESAHTAIPILKGEDFLEANVEMMYEFCRSIKEYRNKCSQPICHWR